MFPLAYHLMFLLTPALSQNAPSSIPKCGLPADPACLVENAQYTVIGTIMSTDLGNPTTAATPSRYNATMSIQCVLASFSSPPSDGAGLVGNTIKVANWGNPQKGCPSGTGATAVLNATQIYFLYVGKSPAGGVSLKDILYSVQSICVGGIDVPGNITTVANVLATFPGNAIGAANRGSDAMCTLPPATFTYPVPSGTAAADAGATSATFNPAANGAGSVGGTVGAVLASLVAFVL